VVAEALREFAVRQLELHREILGVVKDYVDDLLRSVFGIDPIELRSKDPSTYYAITMELARSIFVNWSVEQRQRSRTRPKKAEEARG